MSGPAEVLHVSPEVDPHRENELTACAHAIGCNGIFYPWWFVFIFAIDWVWLGSFVRRFMFSCVISDFSLVLKSLTLREACHGEACHVFALNWLIGQLVTEQS